MRKTLFVLFGAGMLFLACAKPPVEEMNRAVEALSRAENDPQAVLYAPEELSRAREAVENMREAADSKRYDSARVFAEEAVSYAESALTRRDTGVDSLRDEARDLLDSLKAPLAETQTGLNAAAQIPGILLDFVSLEGLLESAKKTYDSAEQSFSAANFQDTLEKGRIVRSILSTVNAQLNDAAVGASRKE